MPYQPSRPEAATDEATTVVPPQGGYTAKTCAERARKDHSSGYDESQKDELGAAVLARMEEGNVFETEVGALMVAALGPDADAVFLPACDRSPASKRARERATLRAMASGVAFIWNARLPHDAEESRTGEPDFLVRLGERRKRNRKFAYAPGDVKHHKSLGGTANERAWPVSSLDRPFWEAATPTEVGEGIPQQVDSMQLAHYHRMLARLGYAADPVGGAPVMGAVIGKERVLVWRDLSEALYLHLDTDDGIRRRMSALAIYDQEFSYRIAVITDALADTAGPTPQLVWKSECGECPWRTVCHDELEEADHISLLPGITYARMGAHRQMGVATRSQLSRLDHTTAVAVDAGVKVPAVMEEARLGVYPPSTPASVLLGTGTKAAEAALALAGVGVTTVSHLAGLDDATAAYAGTSVWNLAGSIDQARVAKVGKVHKARGIEHVSVPRAAYELDVDMENDPTTGIIYLWGTKLTVRMGSRVRTSYTPFVSWDGTDAGEGEAFAQFWAHVLATKARAKKAGRSFRAYCYTQAENRCLRHLADKHVGRAGVPTPEELEAFIASEHWVDMYPLVSVQLIWPTENLTLKSLAKWVRFSWRDSSPSGADSVVWYHDAVDHHDAEVRSANRARLLDYNEDDCHAELAIRDWLSRLGETFKPGKRLPSVEVLDRRFRPRTAARATTRAA